MHMDVQAIIAQVSAALADAPEKLQELVSDPKGTIEELTGHELGEGDLSQIVDGVKSASAACSRTARSATSPVA